MLNFIKEQENIWDYLRRTKKPLVLYGMGNGADKIIARLHIMGQKPAGIFASDEFVRGQLFHGLTVKTYAALKAELGDFITLIAFASSRPEVLARFDALAAAGETYAPHVPIFPGEETVSLPWLTRHEEELQEVYDRLADDHSRQVFAAALNYKLSGKISYLQKVTTDRRADLQSLFHFGPEEVYLDLGAYNGDTIDEFLSLLAENKPGAAGSGAPPEAENLTSHPAPLTTYAVYRPGTPPPAYKHIMAVEPDPRNFKKLTEHLTQLGCQEVTCLNQGVWSGQGQLDFTGSSGRQASLIYDRGPAALKPLTSSTSPAGSSGSFSAADAARPPALQPPVKKITVPVASLDELAGPWQTTCIKLDVEGAELAALSGGVRQLTGAAGQCPKLLVAAYHHDEDLFTLPLKIWQLQPEYKIYLRKHPYVPAWELNFFAL